MLEYGGEYPFLKIKQQEIEEIVKNVRDTVLKQTLVFGIGMHHAGLVAEDQKIVEYLFLNDKIQILIATSTLAWEWASVPDWLLSKEQNFTIPSDNLVKINK